MAENTKTPKPNLNRQVNKAEYEFVDLMKERGITREDVLKYFELPPTEDTLCKLLQLFDLKFTIEEFQDEPFMLVLHIDNDSSLTVIEMGENEDEVRPVILKRMFEMLRVLMLEVK